MAKCNHENYCRLELVRFGKKLHKQGFVSGTDGNLSVRLNQSEVLATPTAIGKGLMHLRDMVVVDLNGIQLRGRRKVSSEIQMHLTIYKMRPDINAIIHAHPCTATGFASAGVPLDERLCSEIVITLGKVPLAPYGTPGTMALSKTLIPYIPQHNAIIMANHGVVTYGVDLIRAYFNMEIVEQFAKTNLVTMLIGRSQPLNNEQLEELHQIRSKYSQAVAAGMSLSSRHSQNMIHFEP